MWGNKRLDYLRDLLPRIHSLNSEFPAFPGSPRNRSVLDFLTNNLTRDELAQVMPPQTRTPRARSAVEGVQPTAAGVQAPAAGYQNDNRVFPVVNIRLLRKEPHSQEKYDDVLFIRKGPQNSFTLSYHDRHSKKRCSLQNVSRDTVLQHVRLMLRLLKEDEDPFDFVQVCFPSLPTCMMSVDALDSYKRDLIYDCLESTLDSWPTA
jgi:hypothetical protein